MVLLRYSLVEGRALYESQNGNPPQQLNIRSYVGSSLFHVRCLNVRENEPTRLGFRNAYITKASYSSFIRPEKAGEDDCDLVRL